MKKNVIRLNKDYQDLIPTYLESRVKDIITIRKAVQNRDFNLIDNITHNLIGSGKTFGFDFISDTALKIRSNIKTKNSDGIIKNVEKIEHYLSGLEIKYVDEDEL